MTTGASWVRRCTPEIEGEMEDAREQGRRLALGRWQRAGMKQIKQSTIIKGEVPTADEDEVSHFKFCSGAPAYLLPDICTCQ